MFAWDRCRGHACSPWLGSGERGAGGVVGMAEADPGPEVGSGAGAAPAAAAGIGSASIGAPAICTPGRKHMKSFLFELVPAAFGSKFSPAARGLVVEISTKGLGTDIPPVCGERRRTSERSLAPALG